MGLFDKISNVRRQSETALSPAESFAAITLIAVAADGYLADEELQAMVVSLSRMRLFRSYPSEVTRRMFDRLCSILQRQGLETLLNMALDTLPHDLYETAFAVAADLALADGEIAEEEEKLLEKLYRNLSISQETATQIVNVMAIKNRG